MSEVTETEIGTEEHPLMFFTVGGLLRYARIVDSLRIAQDELVAMGRYEDAAVLLDMRRKIEGETYACHPEPGAWEKKEVPISTTTQGE